MIYKLRNPLQYYDWGSPSLIPDFLGLSNPEQRPVAELWMGAHPKAPSSVEIGGKSLPLSDLIDRDPETFLGGNTALRFGPRLPFLFKVLAAEKPLSIQCHPDLPRARDGFARENRAGIPLDSPVRNYRDDNHKPEILLAVTPFTALRGFRPVSEITDFFAAFPAGDLVDMGRRLSRAAESDGLKAFLRELLSVPRDTAASWIGECLASDRTASDTASIPEWSWFRRLADSYPGDPGCFAPFYLNLLSLDPGEAVFLDAGELHAYLSGLGVELMANSDNILRGGLTSKHIDIEELLAVLSPKPGRVEVLRPRIQNLGGGRIEETYAAPAEEFVLSVLRSKTRSGDGGKIGGPGGGTPLEVLSPEILLCGEGRAEITTSGETCVLHRGESAFISGSARSCVLTGPCVLYRARVPV
jgi:mannose-6-phosphate isomerase